MCISCTPCVQFMYSLHTYTAHVHLIHISYAAHLQLMCISCTSHVHPCVFHAHLICSSCTAHAQHMCISCTPHVHLMCVSRTTHVQLMHSSCTPHAQLINISCTTHAQLMCITHAVQFLYTAQTHKPEWSLFTVCILISLCSECLCLRLLLCTVSGSMSLVMLLFLIHHGAQLATHLHFTNEHLKGRGVLWPEVCQRWL